MAASQPTSARHDALLREWHVAAVEALETATSLITFGNRGKEAVVLKVVKAPGDEWNAGAVAASFAGNGMVKVLAHTDGAMLLERLQPGTELVPMSLDSRDDEATAILADVMAAMTCTRPPPDCPTVADWGRSFQRYLDAGQSCIDLDLAREAADVYAELCSTQGPTQLLHGDFHHYNVLFDHRRGWVAIDPKGVIGEAEYEVGALMRNPGEMPQLFLRPEVIERRLDQLCSRLDLDRRRATAWTFAQAVLSAIWEVEDGAVVGALHNHIALARAVRRRL